MTKDAALDKAIEIIKEYCRGGSGSYNPALLLETVYDKIVQIDDAAQAG